MLLGTGPILAAVEPSSELLGKSVASFSLPDLHGNERRLDEFLGKPVVLAFLGTECPLAKNYAPRLRDLAAEFEESGVIFLGIDSNLQDSLAEITAFARASGIRFPMLKDNNNVVADQIGAQRTPEVFLLDRQHVIRYAGRIDNQYGFTPNSEYAKTQASQRFLADAITDVLGDKPVRRPLVKVDGCLIGRVAKITPHGDVTYSNQIARIFQRRCVECHRAGEMAPFVMDSYQEVLGWAQTIREVVDEGRMPPWFADPKHGHFSNSARLSDDEQRLIGTWVDNGCPEGNPQELPEPRTFVAGWQMGEPDQIVYMSDRSFQVAAEGVIEYQFFTVDPGWTTDKWIAATEGRPGNRAVVHHMEVRIAPANVNDPAPTEGIGFFGPGFTPHECPPGTAIRVPANSKLIFALHYTANGTPQEDRSMLGIRFADPQTVRKFMDGDNVTEREIRIPPGEPDHRVRASHTFYRDKYLLSLLPHMHLRGKSFRFEAEYPDGSTEVLLEVPRYDSNWQLRYTLAEPKLMPKGAKLHCTAHFDNSAENLANPDPEQTVTFGQQIWNEMMQGFYTSVDREQDDACIALAALAVAEKDETPIRSDQPVGAKRPTK